MFRRLASSKWRKAGTVLGPRTSDDATTEGTASETGRTPSANASAVRGFPGSPATHMEPPSEVIGWSFLNASISRCCFLHFEQFSPFEHLWGLGISCSIPTIETDSIGVTISSGLRFRWCLRPLLCLLGSSVQGEATSSIGVEGFGVPGALPLNTCISFQTFVRVPKEGISSSLRSSNFSVIKIAPDISFSSNFSTIEGSKPASYIHLATCLGVHKDTSLKFKLSTASVNELRGR
jgi:hypothetical protein